MEIFPCFVKAVIKNVDFRKELGIFPTVSYPAASLSFERNILSFARRFTPKINYPILRDICQWQNQCIQQSLPFDIFLLNKMLSCRIQLMYCFLAIPTKEMYFKKIIEISWSKYSYLINWYPSENVWANKSGKDRTPKILRKISNVFNLQIDRFLLDRGIGH